MSLRQIEFGNGLEAWRILRERYESSSRGRQYALLSRVLRPKTFPQEAAKFEESFGPVGNGHSGIRDGLVGAPV